MRRLLSFRALLKALAALALLACAGLWAENWTGKKALAAAKLRLVKVEEASAPTTQPPKIVPDEVNFFAAPPLAGITLDYKEGDAGTAASAHETLRKLEWTLEPAAPPAVALGRMDWNSLITDTSHKRKQPPMLTEGCTLAQPFDVVGAADYLRDAGYIDTPTTASAAEILTSIDRLHPVLKQLSDAASSRPEAVLTPAVGTGYDGVPMMVPRAYLKSLTMAARALALRAQLAAAAGDAESTVRCIQASQRLMKALEGDPSLIGLLVAMTFSPYELNSIWSLLRQPLATEAQLAVVQQGLEDQDFMRHGLQAMRGELAVQINTIDWYKQRREERIEVYVVGQGIWGDNDNEVFWWKKVLAESIPAGWFDHNAANVIDLHVTYLREPWMTGDVAAIMRSFDKLDTLLGERRGFGSPHHLLAALSLPSSCSFLSEVIYTEATRRQALTAVAVERHRLTHGKLPATLAELVPDFLRKMPLDPMDSQPMRYRMEGDTFTLWSIGHDQMDDLGSLPAKAARISRKGYKGDWVWKSRK